MFLAGKPPQFVVGGLGTKPQLCLLCLEAYLLWFWTRLTTILRGGSAPNHIYDVLWSWSQATVCLFVVCVALWFGSQTTTICCGGLGANTQFFVGGLGAKPQLFCVVVSEPNHHSRCGLAPKHTQNSCFLVPQTHHK